MDETSSTDRYLGQRWKRHPSNAGLSRNTWLVGHTVTCNCGQCHDWYRTHPSSCNCGFCCDHRYAMTRIERAQHSGEQDSMSSINICERCESMALGKAMGTISVQTDPEKVWQSQDLCPACIAEFMGWSSGQGIGERSSKAYKTPYAPYVEEPHLSLTDEAAAIMRDAKAYRMMVKEIEAQPSEPVWDEDGQTC